MQVHVSEIHNVDKLMVLSSVDKDATDYFRGVVNVGEMSERVLQLTESIIRMNPAHYSAWYATCTLSWFLDITRS